MNDTDRDDPEREPTLVELADGAVRKIVTGIVIAGAAIALAVYARPSPPRYQVAATETGIVRIDTKSGTVIGCEAGVCRTIVRRGQHLEPRLKPKALPAPSAERAPAAPAAPKAPAALPAN